MNLIPIIKLSNCHIIKLIFLGEYCISRYQVQSRCSHFFCLKFTANSTFISCRKKCQHRAQSISFISPNSNHAINRPTHVRKATVIAHPKPVWCEAPDRFSKSFKPINNLNIWHPPKF